MRKDLRSYARAFIIKAFTFGVAFFFVFGCAGSKREQKPTFPVEEKAEQPKKEEILLPQASEEPPAKAAPATPSPPVSESPKALPPAPPPLQPSVPPRVTKILWESVNLREGPGLNFKVIGNVRKGTSLIILEEKGNWLRVQLHDGREVWVSKAATSEAPKPSPAGPSKPKPM